MNTIPATLIKNNDVVLMPKASRYVRVVSHVTDINTRAVRVTYCNMVTGKGERTKTLLPFTHVTLYPLPL
jgi:hypothetical protein